MRVVRLLSILWVTLIAFGFFALAFPHVSMPSPIQRVLPGSIISNDYLRDVMRFQFAQVQDLVTVEVGRPAAPMAYSNGWGSTVGLLTPFFVLDYFILATPRRRAWGVAIALARANPDDPVAQPRPMAEHRVSVCVHRDASVRCRGV